MFENKTFSLRLTAFDLKRFSKKFVDDISFLLPNYKYYIFVGAKGKLSEAYQIFGAEYEKIYPLYFYGRLLGYLGVQGEITEADDLLMPKINKLILDKLRFYKMHICDLETGFYNEEYFKRYLYRIFKNEDKKQIKTLKLGAVESSYIMVFLKHKVLDLRPDFKVAEAFKKLIDCFKLYLPKILITARLKKDKLAFLFEANHNNVTEILNKALKQYALTNPELYPVVAWVKYPEDLDSRQYNKFYSYQTYNEIAKQKAKNFLQKAEVTLFHSQNLLNEANIVSYGNLIENGGQISQVLPLDRVVINIGRLVGVKPGQVFLVSSSNNKNKNLAHKGELIIYEAADNYALGNISELRAGAHVVQGDYLLFIKQNEKAAKSNAQYFEKVSFGSALNSLPLDSRELFSDLLAKQLNNTPLTLAIIRMDNYEKLRVSLGFRDCEKKFIKIIEEIKKFFPPTNLLAPYKDGMLIAAWPNKKIAKIKKTAEEFVKKQNDDVSWALVSYPLPVEEDIMEAAEKAITEASLTGPGQIIIFGALSLNISGDALFEQGDLFGALKEYEKGLKYDNNYMNLINSRGVCLGRLADFNGALEAFETIIKIQPKDMMAYYNLGYTYLLSGQLQEAEEALAEALTLAPNNFETLYHLGKISLELNKPEKALEYLSKGASLKDRRLAVYRLLGKASLLMHNTQEALKAFKQAVKADPEDAYSFSALGALYAETYNDTEVAHSLFQKSVELDPTNSLYRQRLGRVLYSLGYFLEAEHHLKKAIEYGAKTPEVHYQLGRLAKELQQNSENSSTNENGFNDNLEKDTTYKPILNSLKVRK